MRLFAASSLIVVFAPSGIAQDFVQSWYPLQRGNSWTYQNESLSGNMGHPDFEHWTSEETVIRAAPSRELGGILFTTRTGITNDVLSPGFIAGNAQHGDFETERLIRHNCVYEVVSPWRRIDLMKGDLPPAYCFPMSKGKTWGRLPDTSPANEWVWKVFGFNEDPFGPQGGKTFHLTSHGGSGTSLDRWFAEGVGLVQEVIEHHGTYDEDRRRLVKSMINGKTTSYQLTPARTGPLGEADCEGPGWQHFVREDGSAFSSLSDCRTYQNHRH